MTTLKKSVEEVSSDSTWFGNKELGNSFLVLDTGDKAKPDDYLYKMFDIEWKNKRPILIKNLHTKFSTDLWTPDSFLKEFGELNVNLINCRNHKVVPDVQMKHFWHGFEDEDGK